MKPVTLDMAALPEELQAVLDAKGVAVLTLGRLGEVKLQGAQETASAPVVSRIATLTDRQFRALDLFITCARRGDPPPTLRELAEHLEVGSPVGARQHVQALAKKALVRTTEGAARGTVPAPGVVAAWSSACALRHRNSSTSNVAH